MEPQELEARLNAHREILIAMMTSMMAGGRHDAMFAELEQDVVFRDGEEDPGIVPSRAFGRAAHPSDEIRRLLDAARARCRAST